jgi:O-antigen/teichoic acid export membrane protein
VTDRAGDPGRERREAAAGAGLASLGVLLSGVLNLLLLAVLTRTLSRPEFALFSQVYLIQDTLGAILPLGLPAALAFFVPRAEPGQTRALGFWTGGLLLLLAVPAALVLVTVAPLVASEPEAIRVVRLLGLYVLADLPGQALPAYLLARRAYRGFFGVTLLFTVSRLLSLAIPALLGATMGTLMAWFLVVAALRLALFLWYFLFQTEGSLSVAPVQPRRLFGMGVPLSLTAIVGKLNLKADQYGVWAAAGKEKLAVYSVGAVELPLVSSLAYSVTNALVPTLTLAHAGDDRDGFRRLWHGSVEKVAAIMMPVFFFFLVLADPAIRVLFSAEFSEAVIPFRIYLFLLPLRLCGYGSVLRALGETRPILTASLAALLVNAVLIFPLYFAMGIAGPAVASDLAQLVAIVMLLARIRIHLGLAWTRIMPFGRLGRTMLVAAVAGLPLIAIARLVPGDVPQLLAGAAIMAPLYLWTARWAGIITAGDLSYVGRLLSLRPLWDRRGTH